MDAKLDDRGLDFICLEVSTCIYVWERIVEPTMGSRQVEIFGAHRHAISGYQSGINWKKEPDPTGRPARQVGCRARSIQAYHI